MSISESSQSNSRSLAAIAVPILASVACILCIPPLITHAQARNFPAAVVVFGIILSNLFNFINALIWPTADTSSRWQGYGLCDVEVKAYIGLEIAIYGAIACIFRQLAIILDTEHTTLVPSPSQKRRRIAFEIVLCIILPVWMMIAHYLVQPMRYFLFPIWGCIPAVWHGWPAILLFIMWPFLVCLIAVTYGIVAMYRLLKYRRQFTATMSSLGSTINKSRFVRLFAISTGLILVFFPLEIYTLFENVRQPPNSYSWKIIHLWPSEILQIPPNDRAVFSRWLQIGTGYTVFMFFGFGRDATMMYRSWLLKLGFGAMFSKLHHPHLVTNTTESTLSGHTPLVNSPRTTQHTTSDMSELSPMYSTGAFSPRRPSSFPAGRMPSADQIAN